MTLHSFRFSRLLGLLALLVLGRAGYGQQIVWQEQIGHPRAVNDSTLDFNESNGRLVSFPTVLVSGCNGYAYYNSLSSSQRICYLRYYDYAGTLLNEDTVGGMVSGFDIARSSDSTFLVALTYQYIRPGGIIYDTGQNGGYVLRSYASSGRLLWQKRMRVGTRSRCSDLNMRAGGFSMRSVINMDGLGPDSICLEFYRVGGELERVQLFPPIANQGYFTVSQNPERYMIPRYQILGPTSPNLATVLHFDSAMRLRREDTLCFFTSNYWYVLFTVLPNGKYIATITEQPDTVRMHVFFFDHPGWPTRTLLVDSGSMRFMALADGGTLSFEVKEMSNASAELQAIVERGEPYARSYFFQRRNAAFEPVWTLSLIDELNDTASSSITPVGIVPDSPDDAIFTGQRWVFRGVHSEYPGTYALLGRINNVGRLYDPTALKATAGPRAQALDMTLYPNPARAGGRVRVSLPQGTPTAGVELLDGKGRLVQAARLSSTGPFLILPEGLPGGLYLLRITTAAGAAVRRLVVE